MITSQFIIILSLLVVASYFFDLLNIRIPTVIVQIFFGWIVYLILNAVNYNLPDLHFFLSILSTIGLFAILFEAAMEIEFSAQKIPFYIKVLIYSLSTILLFNVLFAFFLFQVENIPSINQIGEHVVLIDKSYLEAQNEFTDENINLSSLEVNTFLPKDPTIKIYDRSVRP